MSDHSLGRSLTNLRIKFLCTVTVISISWAAQNSQRLAPQTTKQNNPHWLQLGTWIQSLVMTAAMHTV